MTRDLPSLEEPWPGTACPDCGEELRIVGFCAVCFEHSMQAHEVLEAEPDNLKAILGLSTIAVQEHRPEEAIALADTPAALPAWDRA